MRTPERAALERDARAKLSRLPVASHLRMLCMFYFGDKRDDFRLSACKVVFESLLLRFPVVEDLSQDEVAAYNSVLTAVKK